MTMKRMNKRMLAAGLIAASLMSMPIAVQAAPEEKPVQVYLEDDSTIEFVIDPFIEDGTTLVQFRPVFEKLGLKVDWNADTETVTGTGNGVEIKLQIGSGTATVNGQEVKLAAAPRIVEEYTFVPLRFVGEASGLEVGWDGQNNRILLASMEGQAEYALEKSFAYYAAKDVEGFMSVYDENAPEYPMLRQNIAAQLAAIDAKLELQEVKVLEKPDASHAVVQVIKEVDVLKGPDLTDHRLTTVMVMSKVQGEWKLSLEQTLKQENKLPDEWVRDDKPVLAAEEQNAVLAAVEKYRELNEKEDAAGVQEMVDPSYPNLAVMMMQMKQLSALVDYKFTNGEVRILQAKDKSVLVRYTSQMDKTDGLAQLPSMKADTVEKWVKNDKGAWVLADSKPVTLEYRY